MERLTYEIEIDASAEKVWDVLWSDETYREWTKPFDPTSYAESTWKEGDEIRFLTASGEGMYSVIEKKIDNELMSYRHLGMIVDGEKKPFDKADWTDGIESYRLKEANGKTLVTAETDTVKEYFDFMNEKFPQALELLKKLSEA